MKHGQFPRPLPIVIDRFGPNDGRVRARWTDPPDRHCDHETVYWVEVRFTDKSIRTNFGIRAKADYSVEDIDAVIEILTRARDRAMAMRNPEPTLRITREESAP